MLLPRLRPSLVAIGLAGLLSCIFSPPTQSTTPTEPSPIGVSPELLWRTPDVRKGQRITCFLFAGDYKIAPFRLEWYDGNPNHPAAVVFQTTSLPESNVDTLRVTGTCQGLVNGRTLVTECKVTPIRQRLP